MIDGIESIQRTLRDIAKLRARNAKPEHHEPKESVTEREFVRKFGTKVRKVRWSGRGDMVGLLVLGETSGIWITRDAKTGMRYARLVSVENYNMTVTDRKLLLRHSDSLTYLWRGLLNWIK